MPSGLKIVKLLVIILIICYLSPPEFNFEMCGITQRQLEVTDTLKTTEEEYQQV